MGLEKKTLKAVMSYYSYHLLYSWEEIDNGNIFSFEKPFAMDAIRLNIWNYIVGKNNDLNKVCQVSYSCLQNLSYYFSITNTKSENKSSLPFIKINTLLANVSWDDMVQRK